MVSKRPELKQGASRFPCGQVSLEVLSSFFEALKPLLYKASRRGRIRTRNE
jgi:hypothetical protein